MKKPTVIFLDTLAASLFGTIFGVVVIRIIEQYYANSTPPTSLLSNYSLLRALFSFVAFFVPLSIYNFAKYAYFNKKGSL